MASFELAIPILLELEGNGNIVNDPHDPGGLTKWGISKRSYPDLDIADLTRDDAITIYHRDWWLNVYDLIISQEIANKVFCTAVNAGQYEAHVCLQRACNAVLQAGLKLDGLLGPYSINITNKCNYDDLLVSLKHQIAAYYQSLNNPAELNGWLKRAYA